MSPKQWLYVIPLRLRSIFHRQRVESELDEELRFHLGMKIEENIAKGMRPEEARRSALLAIGGLDQRKEECRDTRGLRWLDDLRRDLRYGLRTLAGSPVFTAVALISLSLGIAVASATFSIMNGLVLRDVPAIGEPDSLLVFEQALSYPDYKRYCERIPLFSASTAYTHAQFSVSDRGSTHRIWGHLVSSSYFTILRVNPALGRFFDRQDELPGRAPSVVLSYEFWKNQIGADPNAIGKTLRVNGQACTVIGIGPRDFQGASPMNYGADLWLPVTAPPGVAPELAEGTLERRDRPIFHVLVRLQPGVLPERAEAELDAIARQIEQETQDHGRDRIGRRITLLPGGKVAPMPKQGLPYITGYCFVLGGIILLIASANVANMLLARSAGRRKEIAVRLTIGASRARLVRQLLTECALISSGAGLLGFVMAALLTKVASRIQLPYPVPLHFDFTPDARVLAFTFALTAFTTLSFGLAPAVQATGSSLTIGLKDDGSTVIRRFRCLNLRSLLVVSQVAGSLALLLITGFLVIGHRKLVNGTPGFNSQDLYMISVDAIRDGLNGAESAAYFNKVLNRIQTQPFVVSAALGSHTPMEMIGRPSEPVLAGPVGSGVLSMERRFDVSHGYLSALSIPILRGRDFGEEDETDGSTAVIINEAVAQNCFQGKDPVGQRIEIGTQGAGGRVGYVVGIAGRIRDGVSVGNQLPGIVYLPLRPKDMARAFSQGLTLVVRARPTGDILVNLQREIKTVDVRVVPFHPRSMEDQMDQILLGIRVVLLVYGAIGVFGLILASVGLAGLTSYSVAQRRHEIGIRMAIGAQRINIFGMVMKEGIVLIAIGTIVGFAAARVAIRALAGFLSDVARATETSAAEPVLLFVAPTLLAFLALLCCYLPARRATRVDPLETLKCE
ncbi:MAG: ABC transporter permease [Acidobacteria bacterium]|nr:ABC transporter permease [Acidobacteriota bacterium]